MKKNYIFLSRGSPTWNPACWTSVGKAALETLGDRLKDLASLLQKVFIPAGANTFSSFSLDEAQNNEMKRTNINQSVNFVASSVKRNGEIKHYTKSIEYIHEKVLKLGYQFPEKAYKKSNTVISLLLHCFLDYTMSSVRLTNDYKINNLF